MLRKPYMYVSIPPEPLHGDESLPGTHPKFTSTHDVGRYNGAMLLSVVETPVAGTRAGTRGRPADTIETTTNGEARGGFVAQQQQMWMALILSGMYRVLGTHISVTCHQRTLGLT